MIDGATGTDRLRERVDAALSLAVRGGADRALPLLASLEKQILAPSSLSAGVAFGRAMAYHLLRDTAAATAAADRLLAQAMELEDAGWSALAYAVQAAIRARAVEQSDSFESLVAAEAALRRTVDPGLRATTHTWLGLTYNVLRLYELSVPHLQQAADLNLDPFGGRWAAEFGQLNLAEVHVRWAEDLYLLGRTEHSAQIERLRSTGLACARRAVALRRGGDPDEILDAAVEKMLAVSEARSQPREAIARLKGVLGSLTAQQHSDDRVAAHTHIAVAYRELGQPEDALTSARAGVASLGELADPPTAILAQRVALELAAAAGDSAARAGLALARTIARSWWHQRLRDLHTVADALVALDLSDQHAVAHRAAREDALTGVGNRRAFDERMADAALAGVPISMLMMDVDNLKDVNDSLGHLAGDGLLCRMAGLIVAALRPDDLVARLGGDEFVVVCDDPDLRGPHALAVRLRRAFDDDWSGVPVELNLLPGVSIGHASAAEGHPLGHLLAVADRRLYVDKHRHQREQRGAPDLLPQDSPGTT